MQVDELEYAPEQVIILNEQTLYNYCNIAFLQQKFLALRKRIVIAPILLLTHAKIENEEGKDGQIDAIGVGFKDFLVLDEMCVVD